MIKNAIQSWSKILGKRVEVKQGIKIPDVGGYISREIPALLFPESVDEIISILSIANKYKTPLYPVSIGRNWGLGSKIPINDNTSVMELSKMNKILEINEDFQYAVIEPGVTQGQLSEHLNKNHPTLISNIGGGGKSISVIGNILDRGSGVYGVKDLQEVLAMEVILANGEIVRTGNWGKNYNSIDKNFIHCHPEGFGPDLRGLFIQSNLGIITKMCVKLRKYKQAMLVNIITDDLSQLISSLRVLKSEGIIAHGVNIYDLVVDAGTYYKVKNFEGFRWIAVVTPAGFGLMQDAALSMLKDHFQCKKNFSLEFTSSIEYGKIEEHMQGWMNQCNGKVSDSVINNLYKYSGYKFPGETFNLDTDYDSIGFIVVNSIIPLDEELVTKVVQLSDDVAESIGIKYNDRAFSDLKGFSLKAHWMVLFDRSDENQVLLIHKWKDTLIKKLYEIGIFPQRLDIDSMDKYCNESNGNYWKLIKTIKNSLDIKDIISPGRYSN